MRRSTCSSSDGPFFFATGFAGFGSFGSLGSSDRCRALALLAGLDEVGPAALVGVERMILDRDRPLGDRVEERAVMGDEEHRAGERLERRLERLAALEVEMVRRLVEDEEVGARGDDHRERESPPLAAREHGDLLLLLGVAREEELAQEVLRLGTCESRHRDGAVEHGAALVELDVVLGEVGGLDAVTHADLPAVRVAMADERLEQRRLARAVRADERDVLLALDHE